VGHDGQCHELEVRRADEYQVVGELRTRIASWPERGGAADLYRQPDHERVPDVWLRKPKPGEKADPSRLAGEDVAIEVVNGSLRRTFPQRL
jgi:hypothetical protein